MKFLVLFLLLGCNCGSTTVSPATMTGDEQELISFSPGARVGLHGMVVFGDPQAGYFMSHIPMFHKPHDVQVVFEVALPGGGSFDDKNYTFKPSPFSLDDAILGKLKQVEGELYEGNFEADGTLLKTLTVTIKKIAIPAKLLKGPTQAPASLTYDVVGGRYLVHPIHAPEDFDQILALSEPVSDPIVTVSVANDAKHRLVAGAPVASTTVAQELSALVGPDFTGAP